MEYGTQSQTNEPLNHVFNIVHDNAPLYMKNSFTLVSSSYRNTRSVDNMNFTIPYIKSCQDQTFYYNAIKDWNALPSSIILLPFWPCWPWHLLIVTILNTINLTSTDCCYFVHDRVDLDICWLLSFWPWHMLIVTILAMLTVISTDCCYFDHVDLDIYQRLLFWPCWPWYLPIVAILTMLTLISTTDCCYFDHVDIDIYRFLLFWVCWPWQVTKLLYYFIDWYQWIWNL